ncbi:efflux transporter outer membrane subunit [Owenweeksia hongkongensis]|uniref:efflux transporter outer membrane subunit n=1 Tax=Owenweeksia hongkongensis TaxID=253245 RepID=UPI003A94A96E
MTALRIKPIIWVVPILALVAQSCLVAKNYERPDDELPTENLYRTDAQPEDTTSFASLSWREVFTDTTLVNLIEKGLENNLDIRIAIEQMTAAQAYLKQGKAGYFPTLDATAQWTHQEFSNNSQFGQVFNGSLDQYELSAAASWELDVWGRIRSTKRAAEASYLQSLEAHKAVKTRLIATIATSYYQLLALDEQLQVTRETVENREKGLETTKALKDAGNVTEVGVQQTAAQLYASQSLLIDIGNQIRLQENALSILLGEAPHTIERTDLDSQQIDTLFGEGVPAQLLANRPDVRAAEFGLINAFELTNVARANFFPTFQITATGGYQSLALETWITPQSIFFNLIGSLTQPVFNQRRIRTTYEVSQAAQREALLRFEQSLLTAGREVSDALGTYEATKQKVEIKTKEFEAYDLALQYSEELLNNGLANYLEVLNARENTLASELTLIDLRFMELRTRVQLYTALGGGWQ